MTALDAVSARKTASVNRRERRPPWVLDLIPLNQAGEAPR